MIRIIEQNGDYEEVGTNDEDAEGICNSVRDVMYNIQGEAMWNLQQARQQQKTKFMSASLSTANQNQQRNVCTLCGDKSGSHWAGDCPFQTWNLLAPTSDSVT